MMQCVKFVGAFTIYDHCVKRIISSKHMNKCEKKGDV